ncbi:methionine synthase [Oxobacter pfennigii]|uniref:Methionine synthase n=1 Tax=Oxobacter pfennigii TaxID=36849 RepID=A0A0P8WMV7_9CLOT|nr:cobalamin-dependent protein [Oxobacter pfennigii]KPU43847.1 methionine synthase [Oxobacter pfennigii]
MEKTEILQEVAIHIVNGDTRKIKWSVNKCLKAMIPAKTIIDEGLMAGMSTVGCQFRDNDIYVPEVIMSAEAMKIALKTLKPFIMDQYKNDHKKVLIGTVSGDLHDLGKTLVSIMLECSGFMIVDLGVDISAQRFVEAVSTEQPDILALSCMLTTTLPAMKEAVQSVRQEPAGKNLNILVGGLPVTQRFAKAIGADGYGMNAHLAVVKALAMTNSC